MSDTSPLPPLPPALDDTGRAIVSALADAMGRGPLVRSLLAIKRAHEGWLLQQAAEHLWELYGSGVTCPTCGSWPRDLDEPPLNASQASAAPSAAEPHGAPSAPRPAEE
jgi:hypothetical protein